MTAVGRAAATLALLALPGLASAQEQVDLDYGASGSLRVRGLHLREGTAARELDPTTRRNLALAGDDEVDASQSFLDMRLRLQLHVTAYEEVTARLAIEVGDLTFGDADQGGGIGTDGRVFENKNLYLEWHPVRYSFRVKAGLYPRESDPYGLILSEDVAGLSGRVELLGTGTELWGDVIKATETSRVDLDGDGLIDNDYNDRTLILAGVTSRWLQHLPLEAFFVADLDDRLDSPAAADTEREVFWGGLTGRTRLGRARLASTAVFAYGRRSTSGSPGVTIRGYALDTRLQLELPFVTAEAIFAIASGDRPGSATADEAFPTIAPFYGVSGIVYANFGGFNATGSSLSGTAHTTLVLRGSPSEGLDLELVALWAWYTADHDVSDNALASKHDARDLGFELDLNVGYQLLQGFKAFARGALFFPGHGYRVARDTADRGALAQLIVGAQLDF